MSKVNLAEISSKLDSSNSKDRLLALASLREVEAQDAVPLIKKVLNDEMLPVRSMAVFALGIKKTDECMPILVKLLETDPDYGIRADAAGALGYLKDINAFEALVRAFYEDTEWLVRFSAAVSLGNLGDVRAKQVLLQALHSSEPVLQQAAISALGEVKAEDCIEEILVFAQSQDWLIRQRLAESLGNFNTEKSISALKFLLKDSNPQVSEAAAHSLEKVKAEK
ncbi:MAG: HEAT repeat domain-containing protein [Cyanobacteria bacterium]|nr:HEAT repeat domain-containing protein [Cyanobacteria bacterium CG_2015-16_32_12]NCO78153.1 HEAT repeat domain-containing protein [Cyanobacteria bacterium CG_2015-22_32_23]NCQ03917.1 HEAT repeat domain-containing protein [Cyanobacteria bacterium CG_2015-09_32_10]NCQ42023.1 HEAT repeat domain-containing protein [Cyanobacteria bacterium CG_2015-04_32_10]NCS84087.1 HEAT repeat domain-containing protein [Cyanobacteria bacterium CG_2015-02_32_10]